MRCHRVIVAIESHQGALHMQISTIGLDIAKNVFQVHGIDAAEKVVVRKRLRRRQVLEFFKALPPCLIGMQACATAHYWARELAKLGHRPRLMPAKDVKAYVKRIPKWTSAQLQDFHSRCLTYWWMLHDSSLGIWACIVPALRAGKRRTLPRSTNPLSRCRVGGHEHRPRSH